jgi:hypothetical protein
MFLTLLPCHTFKNTLFYCMKVLIVILALFVLPAFVTAQKDSVEYKKVNFDVIYSADSTSRVLLETVDNYSLILYNDNIILPDNNKSFNINRLNEITFVSGGHGVAVGIGGGILGFVLGLAAGSSGSGGHPNLAPLLYGLAGSGLGAVFGVLAGSKIPKFTSHSFEGYTPSQKKKLLVRYLREYKRD